jgi:hypothetical protein
VDAHVDLMGGSGSTAQDTAVPDFLACDGAFLLRGGGEQRLVAWAGWIRFEGHGGAVIKRSASHTREVRAAWEPIDEHTIRLRVPPVGDGSRPTLLLVSQGSEQDSILVRVADEESAAASPHASPPALYVFEPEDPEGHAHATTLPRLLDA